MVDSILNHLLEQYKLASLQSWDDLAALGTQNANARWLSDYKNALDMRNQKIFPAFRTQLVDQAINPDFSIHNIVSFGAMIAAHEDRESQTWISSEKAVLRAISYGNLFCRIADFISHSEGSYEVTEISDVSHGLDMNAVLSSMSLSMADNLTAYIEELKEKSSPIPSTDAVVSVLKKSMPKVAEHMYQTVRMIMGEGRSPFKPSPPGTTKEPH